MFQRFTVKNFRCFNTLRLDPLARVNLIAGMNNTGKTALLEAIQLHDHPNDFELPLLINKARGIQEPKRSAADVCAWLFHDRNPAAGAEMSSEDDLGITRSLSVWLLDAVTAGERFPEAERQLRSSFRPDLTDPHLPRLVLRYQQAQDAERVSIGVLEGRSLPSMSARLPWTIPSIYLSSAAPSAEQDVQYFGELEAAKRQDEILPALRKLEPRLQRLSLIPLAGEPVLHGEIDGLPRLVPVPFMGEGLRRLLSFLLAIGNCPDGVVLIDEIENGLHYSVLKTVWQALAHAARRNRVQVFATTHSWECIWAAHRAFKEDGSYDFRYHRLDRREKTIVLKSLDERMLDAVEKTDLEIR
jgi:hypothetical protein